MARKKMTMKNDLATALLSNETPKENIVKFKLDEGVEVPAYAHDGDMGMDVKATAVYYDEDTDTFIYSTGIREETIKSIGCLGFARSSIYNKEAYLTNGVGVIDSAIYRGEIKFIFKRRKDFFDEAYDQATRYIATMPWWKKFFLTREKLEALHTELTYIFYDDFVKHALDYAPYEVGDKIGQLVFIPYLNMTSEVVDELSDSERGENGFGSTDKPKESEKNE